MMPAPSAGDPLAEAVELTRRLNAQYRTRGSSPSTPIAATRR
jgi:hypothetical protein